MNNPERTVPEMALEVLLKGKAFTKVHIDPPKAGTTHPPCLTYTTRIYTVKWGRALLHCRRARSSKLILYLPGDPSSPNRYDKACRVFDLEGYCGPTIHQALSFAVRAASTAPEAGVHTYIRGRYIS